jgi:hypothetical protein
MRTESDGLATFEKISTFYCTFESYVVLPEFIGSYATGIETSAVPRTQLCNHN